MMTATYRTILYYNINNLQDLKAFKEAIVEKREGGGKKDRIITMAAITQEELSSDQVKMFPEDLKNTFVKLCISCFPIQTYLSILQLHFKRSSTR